MCFEIFLNLMKLLIQIVIMEIPKIGLIQKKKYKSDMYVKYISLVLIQYLLIF